MITYDYWIDFIWIKFIIPYCVQVGIPLTEKHITIDATPNRLAQSPKLFKTGTFFNQIFNVFFIYLDLSSLGGTANVGLYTSPIEG